MMARTYVRLGLAAASAAAVLIAGQLPAEAKTTVGHGAVTYDDRQVCLLYTSPSPRDS